LAVAVVVGGLALIAALAWLMIYYAPDWLTDRAKVTEFLRHAGWLAPVIFVVVQAFQVIIAPIPGNVSGVVGGWLFGWWGYLLTMLGATIGFMTVLWLSRKFGRPLLEKLFKKDQIAKFDKIARKGGAPALFVVFLIPVLPDDLMSYVAGLTKLPLKTLLAIGIVGRAPSYLMWNLLGMGVAGGSARLIVGILTLFLGIAGAVYLWREPLFRWLSRARHHQ
jgi:uncharacterized membrane protein YdjX (TVP38/TMEM64 family)